jgi:hypothetical protein
MDPLTIALIAVAVVIGYGFGIGATHAMLVSRRAGDEATVFGSMLWPLALPALLGAAAVRRLTAPRRAALPEDTGDDVVAVTREDRK